MAGPTIQLRGKLFGKSEKQKIVTLLKRISIVDVEEENKYEFNFKKGKTLDLFLKTNSCLFLMDFDTKSEVLDDLQQLDFDSKIKDNPQGFINISAMCNDKQDHELLAHFALEINKIIGGYIDLNGAIIPDLSKDANGNYIQQTQEDYRKFVNGITGQIFEINYWITDERKSYTHICDNVWLHNWTLHKNFRLIK